METGDTTTVVDKSKWMNRPLTCEEYLNNYSSIIKYFIRVRLGKTRSPYIRASADDIYQEVCILIFEHMTKHPERNITADVLRQYVHWRTNRLERKEYKSPIRVFPDMNTLKNVPIATDLDEEEAITCMEDCLKYVQDNCSDLNQQIFQLRYEYGVPFKDIDKALGITEGNARKKYSRLMKKVKAVAVEGADIDISNLNDDNVLN
jgi:DNA-directed RNA polymerase specialized sigma24 family protein